VQSNASNPGEASDAIPLAPPQIRTDVPISVIITAYNSERFVAEAIRTVRAQSVRPHEIIVVDDGSSDRTAEIATALRVRVIRQKNSGSAAARNAGTRAATAPWIAYLDVDDLWVPEKLALQWTALQAAPGAGFSFCEYAVFNDEGIVTPAHLAGNAEYAAVVRWVVAPRTVYAIRESLGARLLVEDFILQSSLLVRRDVVDAIGGFDESMRRCEDYEFMLRLLAVADAVIVEQRAVLYRRHGANKSSSWHRSLLERNEIAKRIARNPHRYPAGAGAHFESQRLANINAAAKTLLRSQRYREAREVARSGMLETRSWPGATTILMSLVFGFVPPASALHSALRFVKRRLTPAAARTPQRIAAERDLSRTLAPRVRRDEEGALVPAGDRTEFHVAAGSQPSDQ
jgi:glycosyltransferase involved in cell wall biosynthesis